MFGGKLCPQDWSDDDGSTEPPFSQVLFILACVVKFGLNSLTFARCTRANSLTFARCTRANRLEIDTQIVYRKEYDLNPSLYNIDIIKDTDMISCPEIINEIHNPPKKEYAFDWYGNLVTE
jgi:hypothetical protein